MTQKQWILGILGLVAFVASIVIISDWRIWFGVFCLVFANNLGLEMNKN
jgi:hypothetical protein